MYVYVNKLCVRTVLFHVYIGAGGLHVSDYQDAFLLID